MFSTETIKPTSPAALGKFTSVPRSASVRYVTVAVIYFFCVCTVWFFFFQSCARYIAQTSRVFIFFVFFRSLKEGTYTLHRQGWLCGRPGMTNKPLLPSLKQGVRRFFFQQDRVFYTLGIKRQVHFFRRHFGMQRKVHSLICKEVIFSLHFLPFFFLQLNLLRRTYPWNR